MPSLLIHVTGDRIGDALLKWPVIAALRRALPGYRITWLAGLRPSVFRGPLRPLADGVIDELHDACGVGVSWREFVWPRIRARYDIVVATEPKLRSALLLKRVPHDVFISPALGFALSDRRPARGTRYPRSAFRQFWMLASLAAGADLEVNTEIPLPPADTLLADQLLPAGPTYVGFSPGASSARKCWPLDNFIAVATDQIRKNRVPVFFLGPDEQSWYARLARTLDPLIVPEFDACGARRGGPLLTIALARRAAGHLANDSGGGHLLAASTRPLVSLFGHTSEHKFEPPYGRRKVLRARDFGGTEIARIPVAVVIRALDELLSETP